MIENLLYAFIVVFSVTLAAVAFQAFRRSRNVKVLLIAVAFALFVAKGVLFSVQMFTDALTQEGLWVGSGLLDIAILGTIFAATLKR